MENGLSLNPARKVYTIPEAAEVLGISRSKMYELVHSVGFPVLKIGSKLLIPMKALDRWLEAQVELQGGSQ